MASLMRPESPRALQPREPAGEELEKKKAGRGEERARMADKKMVDITHILAPIAAGHLVDPLVRVAAHDVMLSEPNVTCSSLCRAVDGYLKGGIALLEEALPACRCETRAQPNTRR